MIALRKWTKRALGIGGFCLATLLTLPGTASAYYESDDLNSDIEILDYIENARRNARENRLTPDQVQLAKDAAVMQKNVSGPIDPQRLPVAIEGEDMFYDQNTGDVYAKGAVRITRLDAKRFETEEARGNLTKQEVQIDGQARMTQMTEKQPHAMLDGYRIVYNYGTQQGKMEDVKGKYGPFYIAGRRIELFPEKVLIYDGYETKCGAKLPDYRVSGDLIELYPGKEILVHQAKFWVKNKVIYTRALYRSDISKAERKPRYPRAGYDSDNGAWIAYRFSYDLTPRVEAYADLKYYSRINAKNIYGIDWSNGGNYFSVQYGHYHDSDNQWVKKKPTFIYQYNNRVGHWPLNYQFRAEAGRWKKGVESTHQNYKFNLWHDPINFDRNWHLLLGVGYEITKESYDHSDVKGLTFDTTLLRDFGPNVTAYVGYHYSKATTQNSLFAYNRDDYSKKLSFGVSWAFTDRDRLVIGQAYDAARGRQEDVDYYWFHDMHCAQAIFRYRAKRNSWHFSLQFTPW
ncbi:MAG: LPS-assembly protein LptD [Schwartzia sp.]|nr:LPS-assembly protein LptD [Schwartzia sp. (in: firmicutes)]